MLSHPISAAPKNHTHQLDDKSPSHASRPNAHHCQDHIQPVICKPLSIESLRFLIRPSGTQTLQGPFHKPTILRASFMNRGHRSMKPRNRSICSLARTRTTSQPQLTTCMSSYIESDTVRLMKTKNSKEHSQCHKWKPFILICKMWLLGGFNHAHREPMLYYTAVEGLAQQ